MKLTKCRFHIALLTTIFFESVHVSIGSIITSCPTGQYAVLNDNGSSITGCRPCASCPPGYGVDQACTPTENTVCSLCEMGSYSSRMSSTESCRPCRDCPGEGGVLAECSPISDSLCKTQCLHGEYYDLATDTCKACSYCFPDRPYARTVRVRDCQNQDLDADYQCSPLPASPDVAWPPHVLTAVRHLGDAHRSEEGQSDVRIGLGISRHVTGKRVSIQSAVDARKRPLVFPRKETPEITMPETSDNPDASDLFASLFDYSEESSYTNSEDDYPDATMSVLDVDEVNDGILGTDSSEEMGKDNADDSGDHGDESWNWGNASPQASLSGRSLTSTDIVIVVSIALTCGLISFVITAVTCHCLMRRGKNTGPRVSTVSSRSPSKAWTYQDMMPTVVEMSPLVVDTPPQTRKISCV